MKTIIKFVEVVNKCEVTPFWLKRLKDYVKTDKLPKCPHQLIDLCQNYKK